MHDKKGKTPVLSADEARTLLDTIETSHSPTSLVPRIIGLRDRALIALLTYTFARVGAAVQMRVEDVYIQGRRTWIRLHEKGGKIHEMPCHHNLETYLDAYITAAGIATKIGCHTFRATGITEYLRNGGKLEIAQQMANWRSPEKLDQQKLEQSASL